MDPASAETALTTAEAAADDSYDEQISSAGYCTEDANDESGECLPDIPVQVLINEKNKVATTEQKETILEFIQENPELVTHSSTSENEKSLWKELTKKLNELKPEKSLVNWKHVWYRWQNSVFKKPEAKLKCLDIKLKKFLKQLNSDSEGKMPRKILTSSTKPKKHLKIDEILCILSDIEREKYSLHMEIDENEINILRLKSFVKALENENLSKHKRMRKLNERKVYLNSKRRKIQGVSESAKSESIEVLEKELLEIEKELAKVEP